MTREFIRKVKNIKWNKVFNLLMGMLSIVIIIFSCMYDDSLVKLISSFPSLNKLWITSGFLLIPLMWATEALIIKIIAQSILNTKYPYSNAIKVAMVGQYFTAITPLGVAGQPMQLFVLSKQGFSPSASISLLVRKFLIYQSVFTIFSFFALIFEFFFFNNVLKEFFLFAIIGFLYQAFGIIVLLIFSLNKTIVDKVVKFVFNLLAKIKIIKNPLKQEENVKEQLNFYLESNKNMHKDKKLIIKLYSLTILQIVLLYSVTFFIYKAYNNPDFPIIPMMFSQSFVNMLSSYTPLPGGSGSSESGFVLVFNLFFNYTTITQAMLLWRAITYYSCIIFGAPFAVLANRHKAKKNNTSQ